MFCFIDVFGSYGISIGSGRKFCKPHSPSFYKRIASGIMEIYMKRTFLLVVLDGWGIGALDESNPIYRAEPQAMRAIQSNFPSGALQASGIAVGLPWEEEGNSEVGHLTMGAGKVLYQHFPRVSLAIEDGSFFKNPALLGAFAHAEANKSAVHFVGLLSEGNVHASLDHLAALVKMAREKSIPFFLQLISDGRDSAPESVGRLMERLSEKTKTDMMPFLASVSGRYYAMDRDKHWDRTEEVYAVLTRATGEGTALEKAARETYEKKLNDEYIAPSVIGASHPVKDNDAIVFFNFREDRMRQLAGAFLDPNFSQFPTVRFNNLYTVTMTEYEPEFETKVAFPEETVEYPLGKVLSEDGKTQLRIAETEKYAHVTYFFNGLREEPYKNEFRILIPSQRVVRHDEHPEMMAGPITDRVLTALNERTYDFILVNYANADMVAHTGNYEATLRAVKILDEQIGRLTKTVLDQDDVMVITSDHGNAEVLLDLKTGEPETRHDASPVPIYLVGKQFRRKTPKDTLMTLPIVGMLSDVAPTLLELMGIKKPKEMTGESLTPQLLGEE